MTVDKIRRSSTSVVLPLPDITIRAGDRLLVHETPERLKAFESAIGAALYARDQRVDEDHPLQDDGQQVIEIIVDQRSPLLGRTLQSSQFIENYNMIALAVHRGGEKIESMPRELGNLHLRLGDMLMAKGSSGIILPF